MLRVTRHLITICSAMSLLLFVIVCALWARSHWRCDNLNRRHIGGLQWVRSSRGYLEVGVFATAPWPLPPGQDFGIKYQCDKGFFGPIRAFEKFSVDRGDTWVRWEHAGIKWCSISNSITGNRHVDLIVPYWSLALLSGALPAGWITRRLHVHMRERGRKRMGLCSACGYDLRASFERCPECATEITSNLKAKTIAVR